MRRKIASAAIARRPGALRRLPPPRPQGGPLPIPLAAPGRQAAVTKSLGGGGGGGGNVSGAGNRLGDLLSGWAVPVLIVARRLPADRGARSRATSAPASASSS